MPPKHPPYPKPTLSHTRSAPPLASPSAAAVATNDDEDDYMSMLIPDPTTTTRETLTQRQKRQQREREIRSRPKSKADLAREEIEKREAALARSLIDADDERASKGLRMMRKMGFVPGRGLGKQQPQRNPQDALLSKGEEEEEEGKGKNEGPMEGEYTRNIRLEPIAVAPKPDRAGIGHATSANITTTTNKNNNKRKLEDPIASSADAKRHEPEPAVYDPDAYRDRIRTDREERRFAAQLRAAQLVCEKLDMARDHGVEEADIGRVREVPLRRINVLWRAMVRAREERERERRRRYDMEQSLGTPRLPGYDRLHELDEVDKVALGVGPGVLGERGRVVVEDEEDEGEEDEELAAFEALAAEERLAQTVEYLRREYHYCFWCKYQYADDAELEGCPGTDEDSHG